MNHLTDRQVQLLQVPFMPAWSATRNVTAAPSVVTLHENTTAWPQRVVLQNNYDLADNAVEVRLDITGGTGVAGVDFRGIVLTRWQTFTCVVLPGRKITARYMGAVSRVGVHVATIDDRF